MLRSRFMGAVLGATLILFCAAPSHAQQRPDPIKPPIPQVHEPNLLVPPPSPVQVVPPPNLPRHFESDQKLVGAKLDQLVREAIERNPTLTAAREALNAAEHRIKPAGMPDDPYLGFMMKDLPTTFSMQRENATQKQAIVQQRYPFPGKLTLREAIEGKRAEQSRERMHLALVQLVTAVRSAFADIFLVDKDIEVALEHQQRLRDLVDIATSKYKVGPGLQQDVLNADVALARLDSSLIELSRRRISREIVLATLLNEDRVEVAPMGVLPPATLRGSVAELEQLALATSPEVRERERALERQELAVRLARMAPLPDVALMAAYGSRIDHTPIEKKTKEKNGKKKITFSETDRPDLLRGQIMFDIPLFYPWKQSEQLDEALADLRRVKDQLEASRDRTIQGLRDLLARLAQHEQVAASFRDEVIPVAQAAVSASISAYQVNKVDFLTLLAAQDNLDNYQSEYWRNEAERFRDLADIDQVTGAVLLQDGWNK